MRRTPSKQSEATPPTDPPAGHEPRREQETEVGIVSLSTTSRSTLRGNALPPGAPSAATGATRKGTLTLEPPRHGEPPRIPDWERSSASTLWPDARWEYATPTVLPTEPDPVSADPPRRRGRHRQEGRRQGRRSRRFTTVIVLTALVVVFVAVAATVASLQRTTNRPTPPAAAAPATQTTAAPVDSVAQARSATAAADTATTTARTELHAMPGFPTPTKVAVIINPYVRSLQRYGTFLATARLPASARKAAANARALVTRDVQALGTINGLPSIDLGTYLDGFGRNAAQLQTALASLQLQLGAPRR